MRMLKVFPLLAFLLITPALSKDSKANTYSFLTAVGWGQTCKDIPNSPPLDYASCMYLTRGLLDGVQAAAAIENKQWAFCIDVTDGIEMFALAIKKELDKHRDAYLKSDAFHLVQAAMISEFPCPAK